MKLKIYATSSKDIRTPSCGDKDLGVSATIRNHVGPNPQPWQPFGQRNIQNPLVKNITVTSWKNDSNCIKMIGQNMHTVLAYKQDINRTNRTCPNNSLTLRISATFRNKDGSNPILFYHYRKGKAMSLDQYCNKRSMENEIYLTSNAKTFFMFENIRKNLGGNCRYKKIS
ncbi:hypothetical protein JXQ70_13885 [bacterium]|nr:hypothetical protein [bacterium]